MEIKKCRLCGTGDLEQVYDLGNQYLSAFVDTTTKLTQTYPLTLVSCSGTGCGLIQLSANSPTEILYSRHYWYRSGVNETMKAQLKDIVSAVKQRVDLKPGDIWYDIGANDGTLLRYVPRGIYKVGVEPANNLTADLAQRADWTVNDFWKFDPLLPNPAKVVTAIGMLYDLEEPHRFVADMASVLADDGLIVCQLMTLKQMLENNDVGNICHEHLEFYTLDNLVDLFHRAGLSICEVEENSVNGGSYRLFIRKRSGGEPVDVFSDNISRNEIDDFIQRIEANRDKCVAFIEDSNARGETVWIYGASTKGNVILQYYGLTSEHIAGAADRNPEKWGKVMAGSSVTIHSELAMRSADPDYLLALPYAFREELMERESAWHDRGGRWLFLFPEFEVV